MRNSSRGRCLAVVASICMLATAACREAESSCSEWTPRTIGTGITASLPDHALSTTSFSTADAGPLAPFFISTTFDVDGDAVGIGRQRGGALWPGMQLVGSSTNPPPEDVSQVAMNGVTLFVATANDELRTCIFDSLRYDPKADTGI